MKHKQSITDMLFTTIGFERNFVEDSKEIPKCTVYIFKKRGNVSGKMEYQVCKGKHLK